MIINGFYCNRQRGFSLIEILIVVVIISLFAAAVAFSFNPKNPASELKQESLRLQRVLSIALDEAQIQGQEMGLVITDEGYQFVVLEQIDWQPISDDKALDIHHWPKNTEISLKLEGLQTTKKEGIQQFTLANNLSDKLSRDEQKDNADNDDFGFTLDQQQQQKPTKTRPQIYILSSGETTPFELSIMLPNEEAQVYYQISANYVGLITIDGPFNEEPGSNSTDE